METNQASITVTMNPAIQGLPSSFQVGLNTALEMMIMYGMGLWESSGPAPGKHGLLHGELRENSQQERLAFLLKCIGAADPERTYTAIAVKTRNHKTMDSKVTAQKPMRGLPLNERWHLDCCLNINQKLDIVESLRHLGYSRDFIEFSKSFVKGNQLQ